MPRNNVGRNGNSGDQQKQESIDAKGRRAFFRTALIVAAATPVALSEGDSSHQADANAGVSRAQASYNMRVRLAQTELDTPTEVETPNGDEGLYITRIGNYSKGLPHNDLGEVDAGAYQGMLDALSSGKPGDFEAIPLGQGRKLTNPQAGLAFEFQGADPQALAQKPAPAFASAEAAGEMVELYWTALMRDVPFRNYSTDPTAARAITDLNKLSAFKGPRENGAVTANTLFRDIAPGTNLGPYISQFLWMGAPFGAEYLDRKIRTAAAGVDYMTTYDDWLNVQRGATLLPNEVYDATPRYIRNGRDLGQWVHIDVLYEAYFIAMLNLMAMGAPVDSGNPYSTSRTQIGFGTLGDPYIAAMVTSVAKPALKAVWYQKWFVHRRLRPEAYAGRVHHRLSGTAYYPVHADVLNSLAVGDVMTKFGTYLHPQAFPEGSPTHPSYGAGHATVAGACTTVLKAYFDENFVIPNPIQASVDGLTLEPYREAKLTVGGELNKIAANVAYGRNIAGVHWRSDAVESLKLGEEIAIRYLQQERACFNENFGGYSLTKFDGTTITV